MLLEWKLSWPPFHLTYSTRPSEMVVGHGVCYKLVHSSKNFLKSNMVYWCKDLPSVEAKYFMCYFCIYNLCKTELNDNWYRYLANGQRYILPCKSYVGHQFHGRFYLVLVGTIFVSAFNARWVLPSDFVLSPLAPITFITWARLVLARWSLAWSICHFWFWI